MQIKKVSVDIKDDITFEKILILHKENKDEHHNNLNSIKEMFDKNEESNEKQSKKNISKCLDIYNEVVSGNKMAQMGFDDTRLHKKMAEEKLNTINANTMLIPKIAGGSDKKDNSKDIEGLVSKINNLTNIVIKNQKEIVK